MSHAYLSVAVAAKMTQPTARQQHRKESTRKTIIINFISGNLIIATRFVFPSHSVFSPIFPYDYAATLVVVVDMRLRWHCIWTAPYFFFPPSVSSSSSPDAVSLTEFYCCWIQNVMRKSKSFTLFAHVVTYYKRKFAQENARHECWFIQCSIGRQRSDVSC